MELTLTPGLSVALPLILSSALAALGLLVGAVSAILAWRCER